MRLWVYNNNMTGRVFYLIGVDTLNFNTLYTHTNCCTHREIFVHTGTLFIVHTYRRRQMNERVSQSQLPCGCSRSATS